MPLILIPIAFGLIFYTLQKKKRNVPYNLLITIVIFETLVVLFANVLSIGNHLTGKGAIFAWILAIVGTVAAGVLTNGKDYFHLENKKRTVSLANQGTKTEASNVEEKKLTPADRLMGVLVLILLAILLVLAIFTVPYNYDSMTYHLARIGHWIDNGNVNYYITNVDRQLFSPVLSEYNLLFVMLLSGNDYFLNLQQYLAMLVSAYYIYVIARKLGTEDSFALLGVFAFVSMPLTITQSITTQNDLTTAMFFFLFLYLLVEFLQLPKFSFDKENWKENTLLVVLLGASVGFAFLMKVSVCASMVMFMPWVLVVCIKRKDSIVELLKAAVLAGVTMVVVIAETLIRTYQACGSFTSDTTSGDIMVATKNVSYIIVNILKNYSLLITQHLWSGLNGFMYRIAISVGAMLHVEVNNIAIAFHGFDFINYLNMGEDMYSHDKAPSAFVAYMALLAGVLLVEALLQSMVRVFVSERKKNKKTAISEKASLTNEKKSEETNVKKQQQEKIQLSYGFIISAWLSFGFIMALLRWQPWGSRLMYPALAVTVIASVHILGYFCQKLPGAGKQTILIALAILSFILCIKPVFYNATEAKKYLASGLNQETREKIYFTNNKRYATYKKLIAKAEEYGARDIGVVISGDGYDYPLWKLFKTYYPQGMLRHLRVNDHTMVEEGYVLPGGNTDGSNARTGNIKDSDAPDIILWIERGKLEKGDTFSYYGAKYECVYVDDSEKAPDSVLVKVD